MYKITFNSQLIAEMEIEKDAIGLSLNLHNVSNIPHNIIVSKDNVEIIMFKQF